MIRSSQLKFMLLNVLGRGLSMPAGSKRLLHANNNIEGQRISLLLGWWRVRSITSLALFFRFVFFFSQFVLFNIHIFTNISRDETRLCGCHKYIKCSSRSVSSSSYSQVVWYGHTRGQQQQQPQPNFEHQQQQRSRRRRDDGAPEIRRSTNNCAYTCNMWGRRTGWGASERAIDTDQSDGGGAGMRQQNIK